MKRKIALVSVILLCLTIIGSGSLAYFTAEDSAHNIIVTGGIDIQIVEKTRDEDGVLVDFPEEGIVGGMPGTCVSKIVTVMNNGGDSAWIRVRVTESATAADGRELATTVNGAPIMTYSVDETKWVKNGEWYYYLDAVDPEASTLALFETVCFAEWLENEYEGSTMDLIVYAQAVQTDNNGSSVLDAQGWPEVTTQ